MAAVAKFWAMLPDDVASVEQWSAFGRNFYNSGEWIILASAVHLRSLNVSDDMIYCLAGGLLAGLLIILYNIYYPGEAFDYSTDSLSNDELKKEIAKLKEEDKAARNAEKADKVTNDSASKDSGLRLRKGKGVKSTAVCESKEETEKSEEEFRKEAKERVMDKKMEQIDEAAKSMRGNEKLQKLLGMKDEDIEKVVSKTKQDVRSGITPSEPTNFAAWFDGLFFLCMTVALCYFANRDYGFNVLFWLEKHFPKEAKVIRAFGG